MSLNFLEDQKIVIYTDGGSKGNPGPASIGVVVGDKRYAESIGIATNNVAEYKAVIFALKKAKQLIGKEKCKETIIEIRSDSELLVKQSKGEYKIKEESLKDLFLEIWNSRQDFKKVEFTLIPREKNKVADSLVNSVSGENLTKAQELF